MSSYIWVSIRVHPGGFRKIQILGHLTWEKYRAVLRFHLFTTRWECRVFFWWCMNKTPQFIIFLVLSYLILHLCVRNILSIFFYEAFDSVLHLKWEKHVSPAFPPFHHQRSVQQKITIYHICSFTLSYMS